MRTFNYTVGSMELARRQASRDARAREQAVKEGQSDPALARFYQYDANFFSKEVFNRPDFIRAYANFMDNLYKQIGFVIPPIREVYARISQGQKYDRENMPTIPAGGGRETRVFAGTRIVPGGGNIEALRVLTGVKSVGMSEGKAMNIEIPLYWPSNTWVTRFNETNGTNYQLNPATGVLNQPAPPGVYTPASVQVQTPAQTPAQTPVQTPAGPTDTFMTQSTDDFDITQKPAWLIPALVGLAFLTLTGA